MKTQAWLIGAGLLSLALPLLAAEPLSEYYDNTLVWQNQSTRAVGRMWLNRDGHYFAFYNMGPQAKVPDTNGPFQVQGRQGSYTLREQDGHYSLCLWPAAPRMRIGAEVQHELFSEGACYSFVPHKSGELWMEDNDPGSRSYKMWLVKGR